MEKQIGEGARGQELYEEKKYYEYIQYVKSLCKRKLTAKLFDQYNEIFVVCVKQIAKAEQYELLLDIAQFYIGNYSKYPADFDKSFERTMVEINKAMDPEKSIILLTKAMQAMKNPMPRLNILLADAYLAKKHLVPAFRLYLSSLSVQSIKKGLDEIIRLGNKSETDLLIFRTVKELIIADTKVASELLSLYEKEGKNYPLLHLAGFILETIQTKEYALYKHLLESYKPSLDRDPNFYDDFNSIAEKYFKQSLKPVAPLNSLFKSVMGLFG